MQKIVDGVVLDCTPEEIAEIEALRAQAAAYKDQRESRLVRSKRDSLLAECDWVVIMHTEKGTNIPMEWEVYRQALRDITSQAGFPYEVTWPTKP